MEENEKKEKEIQSQYTIPFTVYDRYKICICYCIIMTKFNAI